MSTRASLSDTRHFNAYRFRAQPVSKAPSNTPLFITAFPKSLRSNFPYFGAPFPNSRDRFRAIPLLNLVVSADLSNVDDECSQVWRISINDIDEWGLLGCQTNQKEGIPDRLRGNGRRYGPC